LLINGPDIRNLDGIKIIFDYDNICLRLEFKKDFLDEFIEIIILELSDEYMKINNIYLNGIKINTENEISIRNSIKNNLIEFNIALIVFNSKEDLLYENGCVLYKVFKNQHPDYHLNILLDE
jgi:hypothetical protein